jgi:hypothetical protein
MVRERGFMNMAVFGNIVTSFSWFGVNMLGIGLHSYGFMDSAFKSLMMFIAFQLLTIGDGLLPSVCWQSFSGANRSLGMIIRSCAIVFNLAIMLIGFLFGYDSLLTISALMVFLAFVGTLTLAARLGIAPGAVAGPAVGGKEAHASS